MENNSQKVNKETKVIIYDLAIPAAQWLVHSLTTTAMQSSILGMVSVVENIRTLLMYRKHLVTVKKELLPCEEG